MTDSAEGGSRPEYLVVSDDCLDVLRSLPDNSVDSIVTDPPYGLGFMGKAWDDLPPGLPWAQECLRVLKPGGHLLSFGGTRTWHRLACAVEDAGFEIRDSIAWMYGSGFPKSHDVSKSIDKAAGAEREVVGQTTHPDGKPRALVARTLGVHEGGQRLNGVGLDITAPATPDAERWQGWGTALKPAFEPIVVARKPLAEKTVAANVLAHGTGALNIDACRVGDEERVNPPAGAPGANNYRLEGGDGRDVENARAYADRSKALPPTTASGRWPANVILDETTAPLIDEQSGYSKSPAVGSVANKKALIGQVAKGDEAARVSPNGHGDSGGASRFFYVAKAPKRERPVITHDDGTRTAHPTVKPLTLMRYLVRMVTPPGGVVLDPFAGSGTTLEAAYLEGFDSIGIERTDDYIPLIHQRMSKHQGVY